MIPNIDPNETDRTVLSPSLVTIRTLVTIIVLLVCAVAIAALAAPALAQDDQDGGPPPIPAAYHGDLEINGDPADEGVTVEAEIDGEVRGSITVGEDGQYGGPGAEDGKLTVDGGHADDGADVTFYVDGENFDRTRVDEPERVTWASQDVQRVDLRAAVDVDDPSPPPEDDPTETEFVAVEITDSPNEVRPGEELTLEYVLENTGEESSSQAVAFLVDGEVEHTTTAALEPDESRSGTVSYATSADDVPELTAAIESEDDGDEVTVSVAEDEIDGPYFDVEIAVDDAIGGDEVTVVATVTNGGNEAGSQELTLTDPGFDGEVRDSRTISLEPDETTETTLSWQTELGDAGTGNVAVSSEDDVATETVTIESDWIVDAGDELTERGTYYLDDDIESDAPALEITGDDIVLEGNGHTITVDSAGEEAIRIGDVENVTVRNLTIVHDVDAPALGIGSASDVSIESVTVGGTDSSGSAENATLSFGGENVVVGAVETPASGPDGLVSLERYFGANATNGGTLTDLELDYETAATNDVDADTIALWKYHADGSWSVVDGSTVDTDAGVITVEEITELSTFGAYAEESDSSPGSGGGGSGGGNSGSGGGGSSGDGASSSAADVTTLDVPDIDVREEELDDGVVDLSLAVAGLTGDSSMELELRIDGETVATATVVEPEAAETTDVTFAAADLSALEPGEYEYEIVGDDETGSATLTLLESAERSTLEVTTLDAADETSIEDVIVDVDGQSKRTGADGRVVFEGLEAGDYTVRTALEGYTDEQLAVTIDGDASVTLDLEAADGVDDGVIDDSIPGFGSLSALVAVVVLLSIGHWRRSDAR